MQHNWDTLRPQIEYFSKPFPREAMAFANAHREEVAPHLLDVLARVVANPALAVDDPDYILHEYALHLLAAWRDTRAYAPLIALGHWSEETLEAVLGDTVTETYGRCLASVCDGDLAPLKKLFEDTQASHWSRTAALDAMVTRVMEGDASRDELIAYVTQTCDQEEKRLLAQGRKREDLEILDEMVQVACELVAVDLIERTRGWLDSGLTDRMMLDKQYLDDALRNTFEETRQRLCARCRGRDGLVGEFSGRRAQPKVKPFPGP